MAMPVEQPLLFPDDVWAVWAAQSASHERIASSLRGHRVAPDAPPPFWGETTQLPPEYGGVGVAGVLADEIS